MRILVNNIKSTNSTLLVRQLKRIRSFPVDVWGTDISAAGHIASSNFVDRYFQAPNINNEKEYLQFINELSDKHKIDYLFVSTDKEVRFLNRHKDEITIPFDNCPSDTINIFQDKLEANRSIEKMGIKVPTIYDSLFGKDKVIFRKRCSVSSQGIYIVDLSKASHIENHFHTDWFAQKYETGTTYVVDIFADKNGSPKLILPRKSLKKQMGSAFRSQIVKHDKLIQICKQIYSKYRIPGLSNVEFIENDSGIYFIEINLRIGGSASEGMIASFNYIEQYLDHFVNGANLESLEYYMNCVAWDSIVSRYYDEVLFNASLDS